MSRESMQQRRQRLARKARRELEADMVGGVTVEVHAATKVTQYGVRRCHAHDKVWYADIAAAIRGADNSLRDGLDPGLTPWWCESSRGYHLAHHHGRD